MLFTLDDISKFTPILEVLLIFCGLIKIYAYYKYFNISIIAYLKSAEVLTLFMESLMAFLIVAITVTTISLDLYFKLQIDGVGLVKIGEMDWFHKTLFCLKKMRLSYILLTISIGSFYVYYRLRERVQLHEFKLSILMFSLGYIVVPLLPVLTKNVLASIYHLDVKIIYIFFIYLLISLVIFAIIGAINEAFKVRKQKYFFNVIHSFDQKETIISTEKIYYIGKTQDYIFFFDEITKSPTIIPSSRLMKVSKAI